MLNWIRQAKLERGEYNTADEFANSVRLTFTNTFTYNPPDHDVVKMARQVEVCLLWD